MRSAGTSLNEQQHKVLLANNNNVDDTHLDSYATYNHGTYSHVVYDLSSVCLRYFTNVHVIYAWEEVTVEH